MTYQDIHGWFNFANVYDQFYKEIPDGGTFVEIGAWLGKSTAYFAQLIKNGSKKINFYTIDHFLGGDPAMEDTLQKYNGYVFRGFIENMMKLELLDCIKVLVADSSKSAFLFDNRSVDIVFIDGCHKFPSVRRDIMHWRPRVKPGGILAGHDYNVPPWHGVKQAVDLMLPDRIIDGVCWIVRCR